MQTTLRLALTATLLACPACNPAPEPPRASTPAPSRSAPAPAIPASNDAATGPVVAHVDGERIEGFKAWYENGVLTLYTGSDPNFEYGRKIAFWHVPQQPAGQRIRYPAPPGEIQHGQMSYAKKDPNVNLSTEWLEEFSYELRIGHEKDFEVEVSLQGRAESPVEVELSGNIVAMTAGIKMTDGLIDRSFDHLDTIQWLTRSWIEERHRPASIAERPDHCMMENAPESPRATPRRQVAACSYLFTDEAGGASIAKLWFEKRDGLWTEAGELRPEQLFRANPVKQPRDGAPWQFAPIAARRFEETIYAKQGGFKRIREPGLFPCGGGQREGQAGWCEVAYSLFPEDRTNGAGDSPSCEVVTYLLEPDGEGRWGISRTLGSGEKFNRKSRQVEPRDKAPAYCG